MKDGRLQASDLMVGDWVKLSKGNWFENRKVELIDIEMIAESVYLAEPIPITKEILEKNGWIQEIYSNESYDNEDIECLSLWVGEDGKNAWWWHAGFELVIPLNYVHEFQHALKLCKIEQEIEL